MKAVTASDGLFEPHASRARRREAARRIKEAKLGLGLDNLPCRGFHANWAYLLITLLAYDLLCWLKLLALPEGERASYAKRLQLPLHRRCRHRRLLRSPARAPSRGRLSAPRGLPACPQADPRTRAGACLSSHAVSYPTCLPPPPAKPPHRQPTRRAARLACRLSAPHRRAYAREPRTSARGDRLSRLSQDPGS